MAEQQDQQAPPPLCAPPPLDHLRPAESAPIALSGFGESILYDRKTGNPGPRVKAYGVSMDGGSQPEPAEDEPDIGQVEEKRPDDEEGEQVSAQPPTEPKEEEQKLTPEQETKVRETLEELKLIFPHFKEDWLRRCIMQVMIKDKWDAEQTVNWIYEYENLAPRKEQMLVKQSVLMRIDDYDTARKMLKGMKHEVNEQYMYFAEVKLTQKFPQFSIYSLRQILHDCDYMYPLAVLNIMEGLERTLRQDRRTWKEWKKNELIHISMEKVPDGKWYKYPLCVVKGEKFWCKKKAKMMGFPGILAHEVRLVEKALGAYETRFIRLKEKLEAEAAKKGRLLAAVSAGTALECSICMDHYMPEEQVSCTMEHEFCLRCLQGAVKEAVTGQLQLSPQGELQCISGKCEGIFPLVMLCHMLPPESLAMFEERIWTDFLAKSGIENLHKCPKCGYAEEVETSPDVLRLFVCKNPRCGHKSCRKCRSEWDEHAGKGCKEMQVDPEIALRMKYDEMMTEVVMRRCIRCKRPQVKNEGCNKLTCQCGAKMCYLCRKPIEEYSHFCQHPTDPDTVCPCGKCQLFLDPEGVDDRLREKMQAQLQEELMELKLKQDKASQAMVTKMTGVVPASSTTPAVVAVAAPAEAPGQAPVAPQQRQFAAIFGGP